MNKIKIFISIMLLCILTENIKAQMNSENGYKAPVSGTVRVFVVFAEVDYSGGGCPSNISIDPYGYNSTWSPGSIPTWANNLFDTDLTQGTLPQKAITDYWFQMSHGKYIVLGDYYPSVITIPCNAVSGGHPSSVISSLNSKTTPIISNSGKTLNEFDIFNRTGNGLLKTTTTPLDNRLDMLLIIWRNNYFISNQVTCQGGYGLQDFGTYNSPIQSSNPLDPNYNLNYKSGVDLAASYNACEFGNAFNITIGEYFHAMFGGNNWHTAGGAGNYTFLTYPANFSVTGQYGATSRNACAWDRFQMGWNGWLDLARTTRKNNLISSMSTSNTEVNTDLTISNNPNGGQYVLRDFHVYGDAIRIKLPHFNFTTNGDIKNQYLWIENHRKLTPAQTGFTNQYDIIGNDSVSNTCTKATPPGILAYIQVGKDNKTGTDMYVESPPYANGVGSWLFPLSAEGRYDYKYRYDLAQPAMAGCANWGNANVPTDKYSLSTQANPFTGFSDLFSLLQSSPTNTNFTSSIASGLSEILSNGACTNTDIPATSPNWVCHNWNGHGDAKDAFITATGKTVLNMGTNPSTAPVYTYTSSSSKTYYSSLGLQSFENRKILLNGVQIKILQEDYNPGTFGPGAMLVEVKWDNYDINNDARWCGNIHLKNDANDPLARAAQINLLSNKTITLDQGKSPTRLNNGILQSDGTYLFADPTGLILETGTITSLQSNGNINVINGSTMVVKSGATLKLNKNSNISVDASSHFCVENLPDVQFLDLMASITQNGNKIYGSLSPVNPTNLIYQNTVLPSGVTYANSITIGTNVNIVSNAATMMKGVNYVSFQPGMFMAPGAGQSFAAAIQTASFINDCSTTGNFREAASGPVDYGDTTASTSSCHNNNGQGQNTGLSLNTSTIKTYPNPAVNIACVETSNEIREISIYDVTGHTMDNNLFLRFNNTIYYIYANKLPAGIYFVKVITTTNEELKTTIVVSGKE